MTTKPKSRSKKHSNIPVNKQSDVTEHTQSNTHNSGVQLKSGDSNIHIVKTNLTGKQRHFARCLAQGMSKTDSYIESYDTENMARKTINETACRLSKDSRINARITQLIELKEQALIRSTVGLKAQVLTKLVNFMDNATPQDSAKLRAAELLGKSIGLFKDVLEDNRNNDSSPEELTAKLIEKLATLGVYQDNDTVQ